MSRPGNYFKVLAIVAVIITSVFSETDKPIKTITGDIADVTFFPDTIYCVQEAITVPISRRCHIPAGVIFLFDGFSKFVIEGTLTVDGEDGKNVLFTSYCDTTIGDSARCRTPDGNIIPAGMIDWEGIHFTEGAEKSAVRYLEIHHAENPVTSDIPYITGRNVAITRSEKKVVLYKGDEVSIPDFFKQKQNDTLKTNQAAITPVTPPKPLLQVKPEPKPKLKWTKKMKIRAGLVVSSVIFSGVTIGSFIHADKHAERRDDLYAITNDSDGEYSNNQKRTAESDADREEKTTGRFAGLGIAGTIFGVASMAGFGITFLF